MLPKPVFSSDLTSPSPSNQNFSDRAFHRSNNGQHLYNRKRFNAHFSDYKKFVQCDFDGCRFRSTNQEMYLHKKICHFQICSQFNDAFLNDSPDEIGKWRLERRSKFPRLSDLSPYQTNETGQKHRNKGHSNRPYGPQSRTSFFDRGRDNHRFSNRQNRYSYRNQNSKKSPRFHQEKKAQTSKNADNPLDLLPCYDSDISDKETTKNKEPSNSASKDDPIISEIIDKLIIDVEKKASGDKIAPKINSRKRKRPIDPNLHLSYSKLNLFQKLMLNDVRKNKNDIIYCLKLIKDTNYLEQI